ncbi:uncharacterized protein LOC129590712 [Paramacrobiotus metropolitanus]|uniref:uncharacterized protein LOC129590712 n=1 Tax=Paramacrobiotus metropolitanus TaxID=2943436 RepID=UPI0024458C5D|nr:uncharacterized protein LOC129590712 [Paramacrobiotus metropolitanus]
MKKQRKRTSVSPVSHDTDATFVEKNGRTYYTSRNGKLRPNQWLFSFTMDIRDDVDGSRTGGLTGLIWLISLHDVPNTVIPVFLSTRSWATKSALMSALFSERSMPTLSVQGDAGLYNLFLDWKYSQFKATNAGRKQSIACLGLQDDFRTVVLSPEVIYYIGEDGARRIQYPNSQYVWVPGCELPEKVVPYTGPEEPPFLLTLRRLLPKSTFYTFLFMLAHSLVSIKYCALITDLFGIPSVVVVGRPDSWKTTLANLTLSFFGRELHTLCNVRQISLPALRERWQKLRLPHIFHDVADIPTLREVILASFEQQLHVNYRTVDEPAQPTSSVLITANAGNAEELVQSGTDRERLTSRIVFLQIDEPVTDWDFSDAQAFQRGKAFAATYAELLLGLLSPDSLNGFLATVYATQKT